jgi:peptide/nickel transport system permease protein
LTMLALILTGAVWTPYDPGVAVSPGLAGAGPVAGHYLGVDGAGRDLGSQLWAGAAHTVALAGLILLLNFVGAALVLALERSTPVPGPALVRGAMRLAVAAPVVLLAFLLVVVLGPSPVALVLAAAVGNLPLAYRELRAAWLHQRTAPHVQASDAIGGGGWHRWWFSIWPNIRPQLGLSGRLLFVIALMEVTGLAYLGLMGAPGFPELGLILRQAHAEVVTSPWGVAVPGLVLVGLLAMVHATWARADAE